MHSDYKDLLIVFLVFLLALVVTVAIFWRTDSKEQEKITGDNNQTEVIRFFNENTTIKDKFVHYEWRNGSSAINEEDIFSQFNVKKLKDKNEIRKGLYKEHFKRIKITCKQLNSAADNWSLGYCVEEDIKQVK